MDEDKNEIEEFNKWSKFRSKVNYYRDNIYFKERDIYWASLGKNIGREQDGKNWNFTRPVLIIKRFSKELFLGLPLSSKIKENNKFYYIFGKDSKRYSVVLSQIRCLSSKRLYERLFRISKEDFKKIKEKFKDLISE